MILLSNNAGRHSSWPIVAFVSEPRKQHQVPVHYLNRFTNAAGRIDVYDAGNGRLLRNQSPKNVAVTKDFYTADNETGDRFLAERGLSDLESTVDPIISRIDAEHQMPADTDRDHLFLFLALLVTRIRSFRDITSGFIDRVFKKELLETFLVDSAWDHFKQETAKLGNVVTDEERQEYIDAIRGDEFKIDFDKSWHIGIMLEMATHVRDSLLARRWQIIHCPDGDALRFVTSDRPIVIDWRRENQPPHPPGFASPDTILHIPLSQRTMLIGVWPDDHGEDWPDERPALPGEVALLNGHVISQAWHQIYASPDPFIWMSGSQAGILQNVDLAAWVLRRADEQKHRAKDD